MPQAIGQFVALAILNATGASLAVASVIGAAVGYGLVIGASILVSSLFTPKPRNPSRGAEAQAVLNQAAGARIRVYGRAKVGGTRAFFDSVGGDLWQIIMLAAHEIDAIEQYWVGDDNVTSAMIGSGVFKEPYQYTSRAGNTNSFIRLWGYFGTANQGASPEMMTAFPSVWTSAHRLRGIAYVVARLKAPGGDSGAQMFSSVFPQSYNTPIRCVIRGAKVWDPRTDITAWSENPALCILDYITHPDGMGKPLGRIDTASFVEFANICDQNVALKSGGTEKRYRLGGTVALTEDPVDVLQRMLATCDGELYPTADGKIGIRGGVWAAPTVTITDQNILAMSDIAEGNDAFSAYNELKIVYTSPLHDYQPQEAVPWVNVSEQAQHGQIVEDFVLDMVPSPSQARRLAKIRMHKDNPEIRGSIATNLAGLNALGEGGIDGSVPELLISHSFRVSGFTLRSDLTGCEIGISSLTAAAYAWNPAVEEGDNPPPPQNTSPSKSVPVPAGLSLSIVADKVTLQVADPGRDDLRLQAQIKAGAGGTYAGMPVDPPEALDARATSEVSTGVTYYVRARWALGDLVGAWSAEAAIAAP